MTRASLPGRLSKLEAQRQQEGTPLGPALLEALPAELRPEVEDLAQLEESARSAPDALAGNLPGLALWAFLSIGGDE